MTEDMDNAMEPETAPSGNERRRRATRVMAVVATAVAVVAGGWYYLRLRSYESTDNAFIEGNVIQVGPRVPGQVLRVLVADNQHVNQGDLIAEIDPKDYQARLEEARGKLRDALARASGAQANLALTSEVTGAVLVQASAARAAADEQVEVLRARLNQDDALIGAARAALAQAEAHVAAAEANAERAAADARRYRALYAKDEISRQQLDRAEAETRAASANLAAARQAVAGARAQVAQTEAGRASTLAGLRLAEKQVQQAAGRVAEAHSAPRQMEARRADIEALRGGIEQQRAAVQQAELALGYTRVYAAESGTITRKSVEPGNFVQTGQPLLALVADRLWVVANFKETQLTHMRPGQMATLKVDAYPQLRLKGRVDSIQSGTGARFSLLPPENATGNYVKVVQRVPVKIVFEAPPPGGYKIGPGMSVEPEVKVR